jgi:PKD repeat protein
VTIPVASKFPTAVDTDDNLFLVHDSLRVRLSEDYSPGDTTIYIEGDTAIMAKFPSTGIITLTEQCSEIDKRALSFYYSSPPTSTPYAFSGLELLPEFSSLDSSKPKKATNVTMNVLDLHHNHLKDALIAVETFVGTKYNPENETITKRISHLQEIALPPKAWFSSNASYGLAPLEVVFTNESLRVGEGYVKQTWTFKQVTSSSGEATSSEEVNEMISYSRSEYDSVSKKSKTFAVPGVYTVKLAIENDYGSDEVEFEQMVVVKTECPDEAAILIGHRSSQNYTAGDISLGTKPKIRSSTNMFIDLEIPEGENPDNPGYSYGGEFLRSGSSSTSSSKRKIDPIVEYTWRLGDDLPHSNSRITRASYDTGGYYDIVLRVDTSFGSYRITSYEQSIDIVEQTNLWMFNYEPSSTNTNSSGNIQAYEFGLNSETFKTLGKSVPYIDRDNSFLSRPPLGYNDRDKYYYATLERAKNEFANNVEFTRSGSASSGNKEANSLMFWAKGGDSVDSKQILVKRYSGFDDVYENLTTLSNRPWNWVALSSSEKTYFLLGQKSPINSGSNLALAEKLEYDLATNSAAAPVTLSSANFENGADELLSHPSSEYETNGYFASYRSAWKDQTGYILRNSSVNEFFRFGDFYKTKGSLASPFDSLTRMPDMPGSIKMEGQLVSLYNGVFFFNNSGEICAWNDTSLSWEVGRASSTSLSFRSVQDTNANDFDNRSNTLKAASDGDRMAYLSYDYSRNAFVKFNGTDLTFTLLRQRPEGKQFKIGVY